MGRRDRKAGASSGASRITGIGPRLRAARESKGWTREALAYHSGVSWAAIAQIESGRRSDVHLKTLAALSSALGVSADHLLGQQRAEPSLDHQALVYRTMDQFLRSTVPFLVEGAKRGDGLVAATAKDKIKLLRKELGSSGRDVTFLASDGWYRDPYTTLEGFRSALDEKTAAGHGWVRVIGEPVWLGRSPEDLARWVRYEALVNLALADARATIVCPYDASALPPAIVRAARRTHPKVHGEDDRNSKYRDSAELLLMPDARLL